MREMSLNRTEFMELSTGILGQGSFLRFKARGSSMFPFIRDGDVLTVQPANTIDLNVGDVAFYRSANNGMTAHRIVGRKVYGKRVVLSISGDATPGESEQVPIEQVLGQVVNVQRDGKIIRMDGKAHRLMVQLWIGIAPLRNTWLIKTIKRSVLFFLRQLQRVKPYRAVAGKLIGKHVHYRIASAREGPHLARFYGHDGFPELGNTVKFADGQLERPTASRHALIAVFMGQIVGAAVIRQFPENVPLYPGWWLFGMRVRTPYRGTGIGEGLVKLALEKAASDGATRMNLLFFEQNTAAINLYRKMGFRLASIPELDKQLKEELRQGEKRRTIWSRPL